MSHVVCAERAFEVFRAVWAFLEAYRLAEEAFRREVQQVIACAQRIQLPYVRN